MPPGGSPPLQSVGQNQRWPESGQGGYITPAASPPPPSERGAESEVAHNWTWWLPKPCYLGGPTASEQGAKSEVAHKWARWLHNPCRLGGGGSPPLHNTGAESEVAHKWARQIHNPYRLGGSPLLQSGGQNHRWPTDGQGGYITPAAWGVPTASQRGAESRVAQKWARWLHNPCRQGGEGVPTPSERGAESEVAHKWARWLHSPCRLGVPTALERGAESQVGHKWARWLHNPCRQGEKIRSGPQVGKVAT